MPAARSRTGARRRSRSPRSARAHGVDACGQRLRRCRIGDAGPVDGHEMLPPARPLDHGNRDAVRRPALDRLDHLRVAEGAGDPAPAARTPRNRRCPSCRWRAPAPDRRRRPPDRPRRSRAGSPSPGKVRPSLGVLQAVPQAPSGVASLERDRRETTAWLAVGRLSEPRPGIHAAATSLSRETELGQAHIGRRHRSSQFAASDTRCTDRTASS